MQMRAGPFQAEREGWPRGWCYYCTTSLLQTVMSNPFFLLFISSEKIHLQHKPSQFIRLCLVCCWFVITLFVHDGIKNNNVYYTCNNQGNSPPTHDQPTLTTPKQRVKKKKKKLSSVCGLCILLLSCHPIPMTSHVCVKPYTGTLRNPSSAAPECNRWRHEDYLVLDR